MLSKVNAFAMLGRHIFVLEGLLRKLESENNPAKVARIANYEYLTKCDP